MASFVQHGDETRITVPRVQESDKYTLYEIQVEIGTVSWTVLHRYSDFAQLQEILVAEHGVAKDILPPKKVIGNKEPSFIEKRRIGLENYLSTVVRYLQKAMPKVLAAFLNFYDYDTTFLLQNMALKFFHQGETLLMKNKSHTFTPLEMYAISERLKQPCPVNEHLDRKQDFGHVLDYCSHLTELVIQGSDKPVKRSNIIPNKLQYEFGAFKSLEKLTLLSCSYQTIYDLNNLRRTLKSFEIHRTSLRCLTQVLLCDQIHKDSVDGNGPNAFINIACANFGFNQLTDIDQSIRLLPNVESLNFENNQLEELQHLTNLSKLRSLNLSKNKFTNLENLELKLGKIVTLDLSQNYLTSLKGFSKLYSLETLDVRSNQISDISEVRHICNLPSLENLVLTGNPVSVIVDYRVKVLELFDSRALELYLDNEKSNQKELDKVAVLQAFRFAKEGRNQIAIGENK